MSSNSEGKNLGGRPRWEPTEAEAASVAALCATGAPHTLISWYLQRDIKTLKSHFPEEFEQTTRINKNQMVEYSLFYKAAFKHDTIACMAWLKYNMGEKYSDKVSENLITKEDLLAAIAAKLPN